MPVGFPTKVNYATGDVLSATNMNDLSGTVNLLEGTQKSAGKNALFNSAMEIWQRGTSFTTASIFSQYTADRWYAVRGATTGATWTRQLTNDTTNLPFIQYCFRGQRDSGNTSTTALSLSQTLENVDSTRFIGQIVTLSFYARAGANYSAASSGLVAQLKSGTGTDQNVLTPFTGSTNVINQTATLTTTWQRFSYTGTVSTTATQLAPVFIFIPSGTAGANDYFEVTGVQLELGSTASAFARNNGTIQGELAACQRYYYRQNGTTNTPFGFGMAASTTSFRLSLPYKQPMRVAPSSLDFSALQVVDTVGGYAVSNLVITAAGTDFADLTATSTGMTAQRAGWINGTGTCYIGLSAEL
jgi:hypothetical protein